MAEEQISVKTCKLEMGLTNFLGTSISTFCIGIFNISLVPIPLNFSIIMPTSHIVWLLRSRFNKCQFHW